MKAKIRKIDLLTEIDEKIPAEFNTDPRRLTQILMNLVGNAMKFTFKGYVKIKVEFLTIHEYPAIKFLVQDTGYGIKKEN